jgi:hypothetical protein
MAVTRFPIRFTGANKAMTAIGMTRATSYVDVDDDDLRVRMGWGFRLAAPRSSVRRAVPDTDPVYGWGAHGWRGVWLVNGSSSGIVRVELDPPGRGRTLGVPVRVRVLRVAVEDPDGLIELLKA